jgi:hypothetical protein
MMKLIEKNIEEHGFHAYLVGQSDTPRFVYTIGLHASIGAELALPGAAYFNAVECARIVHSIRKRLDARIKGADGESLDAATARAYAVKGLGMFTLRRAHDSWARKLLLGAFDYYRPADVVAYQIVPDASHHTVDIPDMSKEWSAATEPVWRYLDEPWPYPFSTDVNATTNLAALLGDPVTEVTRYDDGWEIFAGPGPNVTFKEMRVVPITCLVGADPTLARVLELEIGAGLWRDDGSGPWKVWDSSSGPPPVPETGPSTFVLPKLRDLFKRAFKKRVS